jgi:hypothetical protein
LGPFFVLRSSFFVLRFVIAYSFLLVPKLGLGTHLPAKLSLAPIFVPKYNLGMSTSHHFFLA